MTPEDPRENQGVNPKIEDGFFRIANETAEAFSRLQLSGNQWRLLWVILRQTYGWNKKVDSISLSFFEKKTGIKRRHVSRELTGLIERNIIRKTGGKGVPKTGNSLVTSYGLQKDFTKWQVFPKLGTVPKTGNRGVPKIGNHKRHIIKTKDILCLHHGTEKIPLQDGIREILDLLNSERSKILGTNGVKPITQDKQIKARLTDTGKDRASVVECCRVILTKAKDPYFQENPKYFHPETLFRKSNFRKYADEAEIIRAKRAREGTPL